VQHLSTTIYRNEFAYSFEKFATRMKTAFTVLEKHGEPYAETAKVKMLHDHIQVPGNNLIQIAKSQLLDQHGTSFSAAVSYMSRKVAEIFPEAFDQDLCQDNQRKRNVSEARMQHARNRARGMGRNRNGNDRGGRWRGSGPRDGRNRGRGDRSGGRGATLINGINVSDPHRTFTALEFQTLGASGSRHVTMMHEQRGAHGTTVPDAGGIRNANVSEATVSAQDADRVSSNEPHTVNQRGGRNGARFGQAAYNSRS
jgi:hypothetical protein